MSCIMWQSGLAAGGHVGVATRASGVLFMTRRGVHVAAVLSRKLLVNSGGRVLACPWHVFFKQTRWWLLTLSFRPFVVRV